MANYNLQVEKSLLAILIHSIKIRATKIAYLKATDFTDKRNINLFKFLNTLFHKLNNGFDVNLFWATISEDSKMQEYGGHAYISEILSLYNGDVFFENYFNLLINHSIARDLNIVLDENKTKLATTKDPQTVFKELYLKLNTLETNYKRENKPFIKLAEVMQNDYQRMQNSIDEHDQKYFSTGFSKLDQKTNGFKPGQLIILAGRPSMGKTALALNLMLNDFFFNKNSYNEDSGDIIFFSLEMSPQQLSQRIIKTYLDLTPSFFKNHKQHQPTENLIQDLKKSNIFIDVTNTTDIFQIHAKLRKWSQKRKIRLIAIDYLQLLKPIYNKNQRFENRNQEVAFWTRSLKEIAIEFNIPVVCLSQLSRSVEKRENKRPLLSDLRDSGSIEQDADLVLFLYREEYYLKNSHQINSDKMNYNEYNQPQKAEIIIAKQRDGPTGSIEVLFVPQKTTFMDYFENEEST